MNPEEKRRFKRFPLNNPVRYEFKEPGRFGGSLSYDISEGGIRMSFGDFIPLNSEIAMQVFLNPQKVIECIGRVIWIRKVGHNDRYEAGLEFSSLGPLNEFKGQMNEFVETIR